MEYYRVHIYFAEKVPWIIATEWLITTNYLNLHSEDSSLLLICCAGRMFISSRFHDPQREILGDVRLGGMLKSATARSVKFKVHCQKRYWLVCFETTIFKNFLMPLADQLKFLDLCSMRTRGSHSAEGNPFTFHSLSEGGPFTEEYVICVWFSLISKLKLFVRLVVLSNFIKNCQRKLITVELGRLDRDAKGALFESPSKSAAAPSLEKFVCIHLRPWIWTWF